MKKPKLSSYQAAVEILSLVLVIATAVYIIMGYAALPDRIAGHFNSAGEVTDYTGKGVLWLLLGIEALMYIIMTALIFIPKQVENPNMPWDMDERYKKNIAVETVSLLGESKLMCLALFSYMCWSIISQKPLSLVPVFALCVLITVDVIWRTIRISKYKKTVRPSLTVFTLQIIFQCIEKPFQSFDGLDIRLADTVDVPEIGIRRNVGKLVFGMQSYSRLAALELKASSCFPSISYAAAVWMRICSATSA